MPFLKYIFILKIITFFNCIMYFVTFLFVAFEVAASKLMINLCHLEIPSIFISRDHT